MKTVSSKIQTVVKTLLTKYNNANLPKAVRHEAGMALKHLAHDYPLDEFYHSHIRSKKPKYRSDDLIHDRSLEIHFAPVQEAPKHRYSDAVALHPFLAFLISKNRFFIDDSSLSTYFDCSERVCYVPGDLPARTWWNRYVMVDSAQKAKSARDWWSTELTLAGDSYQSRKVMLDNFKEEFADKRRASSKDIAKKLHI